MKKKYLSPEVVELVEVLEDLMDATSFNGTLDNNNTIDPEKMLSRRSNVWDDDEE